MVSNARTPEAEITGTLGARTEFVASGPRRRLPERLVRPILLVLALGALQVGLWLLISPRSFYDDFPGFGRTWVSVDGPYNEHAFRDFGNGQLATAVILLAAFLRPQRYLVRTAALAYLLGAVPHLVYHANHLDLHDTGDQVANLVALGATVVLPAVLLLATVRGVPDRASNE
ncbi:MAG: hypothetical protein ACRD0R_03360 [Acidimicrobiales bacterium]